MKKLLLTNKGEKYLYEIKEKFFRRLTKASSDDFNLLKVYD
jgi:hypothetical protein